MSYVVIRESLFLGTYPFAGSRQPLVEAKFATDLQRAGTNSSKDLVTFRLGSIGMWMCCRCDLEKVYCKGY